VVVSPRLNTEVVSGPLGAHDRLEKLPGFGPDEKLSSFIPGLLPQNGSIRNGEPVNSTNARIDFHYYGWTKKWGAGHSIFSFFHCRCHDGLLAANGPSAVRARSVLGRGWETRLRRWTGTEGRPFLAVGRLE
jgi:hypothetical protein